MKFFLFVVVMVVSLSEFSFAKEIDVKVCIVNKDTSHYELRITCGASSRTITTLQKMYKKGWVFKGTVKNLNRNNQNFIILERSR